MNNKKIAKNRQKQNRNTMRAAEWSQGNFINFRRENCNFADLYQSEHRNNPYHYQSQPWFPPREQLKWQNPNAITSNNGQYFPPRCQTFPTRGHNFPPSDPFFPSMNQYCPPRGQYFPSRDQYFPPSDSQFPSGANQMNDFSQSADFKSDSSESDFELTNIYFESGMNNGEIESVPDSKDDDKNDVSSLNFVFFNKGKSKHKRAPASGILKKFQDKFRSLSDETIGPTLLGIYKFLMDENCHEYVVDSGDATIQGCFYQFFSVQSKKITKTLKRNKELLVLYNKILLEVEGSRNIYKLAVKYGNKSNKERKVRYIKTFMPSYRKDTKVIKKTDLLAAPSDIQLQQSSSSKMVIARGQQSSSSQMVIARGLNKSQKKLVKDLAKPIQITKAEHMMKLMGYSGGGLGAKGDGIKEPIMPNIGQGKSVGLGHTNNKTRITVIQEKEHPVRQTRAQRKASRKAMKSTFMTNVLIQILEFVQDDTRLEIAFDNTLKNKERKDIHRYAKLIPRLVDYLRNDVSGGWNFQFETVEQMELAKEIQEINNYYLHTESEGSMSTRQLYLYKSSNNTVYQITPDDLFPDYASKEMARNLYITKTLLEYMADFIDQPDMEMLKVVGKFCKQDAIILNWFVSAITQAASNRAKIKSITSDEKDLENLNKFLMCEDYLFEVRRSPAMAKTGHFSIVKRKLGSHLSRPGEEELIDQIMQQNNALDKQILVENQALEQEKQHEIQNNNVLAIEHITDSSVQEESLEQTMLFNEVLATECNTDSSIQGEENLEKIVQDALDETMKEEVNENRCGFGFVDESVDDCVLIDE